MKYQVQTIPTELFENCHHSNAQLNPNVTLLEKPVDFSQSEGIFCWIKGWKYPLKGYPYPPCVDAVATVKRLFFLGSGFFKKFWFIFLIPFLTKNLVRLFIHYADFVLGFYYLTPNRYCISGRELYRAGMIAANNDVIFQQLVKIIIMFWEFDDAYRYRGQDALGEAGSFEKMFIFLNKRELNKTILGVAKWKNFYFAVKFIKIISPKWRKFLNNWEKNLDYDKIKLDDADKWIIYRNPTYNYNGLNFEERMKIKETL